MSAPKENEYYLLRSKDGRDTTYTPESLLEKANEYFNWCLENPLMEATIQKVKVNGIGEEIRMVDLPKMRPFTLQGFCNFAEIVIQTFHNYENTDKETKQENTDDEKGFLEVTTRIRGIIENQQFEGAASGFLNPNIIARKLGLVDRKSVNGNMSLSNPEVVLPDGTNLEDYLKENGLT